MSVGSGVGENRAVFDHLPVAEPIVVTVYNEVVNWTNFFFLIPNNSIGKAFVHELSSQLQNLC